MLKVTYGVAKLEFKLRKTFIGIFIQNLNSQQLHYATSDRYYQTLGNLKMKTHHLLEKKEMLFSEKKNMR